MTGISEKINKLNKIDQCDLNSAILTKKLNVKSKGRFYKICDSLGLIKIGWVRKTLFSIDIERSSKKLKKTLLECNQSARADKALNKRVAEKFNHLIDDIAQKRAAKGHAMSPETVKNLKIDIDTVFPKSSTEPPIPPPRTTQHSPTTSWDKLWKDNPVDQKWFKDQFCTQNADPIPPSDFPALTTEDLGLVRDFCQNSENFRPARQPGKLGNPPIMKRALTSLFQQDWIADPIIAAFSKDLLAKANNDKVHILDCRAFDLFLSDNEAPENIFPGVFTNLSQEFYSHGKLLIPIYQETRNHWTLIEADFAKKTIRSYDSLGTNPSNVQVMEKVTKWMDYWLEQKGLSKNNWLTEEVNAPRQNNGSDCGAFVCRYMEKITKDSKHPDGSYAFNISAANMPYYRFQILASIAKRYQDLCRNT